MNFENFLRSQKKSQKRRILNFKTFENFNKKKKENLFDFFASFERFEIRTNSENRFFKSKKINYVLSATNVPEINKHRRKRCSSKICSLSSDVPGSVALSRHLQ